MRLVQDEPQVGAGEVKWAAGLYDGEGSSFLKSGNNPMYRYPVISVTNTDTEVLRRFNNAVGGLGRIDGPYNYNPKHKPKWILRIDGFERAQAVIAMLWGDCSTAKRDQARATLGGVVMENYRGIMA